MVICCNKPYKKIWGNFKSFPIMMDIFYTQRVSEKYWNTMMDFEWIEISILKY